jgi:ATP-dependent DNA helicase RecQ
MSNVVFIDLEVNPQTKKVLDYGAIKSNGINIHTTKKVEFENFIKDSNFICGHNIFHHDSKYFENSNKNLIDTLYLSPLLFPEKPYHKLLKDDKIVSDDLSNPLNDAIKAKELFYDEINEFQSLNQAYKNILINLLYNIPEFRGFFVFLKATPQGDILQLISDFFF